MDYTKRTQIIHILIRGCSTTEEFHNTGVTREWRTHGYVLCWREECREVLSGHVSRRRRGGWRRRWSCYVEGAHCVIQGCPKAPFRGQPRACCEIHLWSPLQDTVVLSGWIETHENCQRVYLYPGSQPQRNLSLYRGRQEKVWRRTWFLFWWQHWCAVHHTWASRCRSSNTIRRHPLGFLFWESTQERLSTKDPGLRSDVIPTTQLLRGKMCTGHMSMLPNPRKKWLIFEKYTQVPGTKCIHLVLSHWILTIVYKLWLRLLFYRFENSGIEVK